jgi:TPP-dependent indolepyruvate ferredoxin oxidoreductase alpha subunit
MEKVLVLDTIDQFVFEEIKALLKAEDIPFTFVNKASSMFNNFGNYEIYVTSEFETSAKELISNAIG